MSIWPTNLGNYERTSTANFPTALTPEVWNYPLTGSEFFVTAPVISPNNVWAITQDNTGKSFLLCLDMDGLLVSHTRITNKASTNPVYFLTVTVDDSDNAYVPVDDGVRSYDTTGAVRWTTTIGFDGSGPRSCAIAGDGFIYVCNVWIGTVVVEALITSTGVLDHEFDTGQSPPGSGGDSFALSGTSLYIPMNGPSIGKWETDGTLDWFIDLSADYTASIFTPSVANGHVYVHVGVDRITFFDAILSLDDSDGSTEWIYSEEYLKAPGKPFDAPCVSPDGTIFAPLDPNFDDPITMEKLVLAGLDPANGNELWRYSSDTQGGGQAYAPSCGNDGLVNVPAVNMDALVGLTGIFSSANLTLTNPFPAVYSSDLTIVCDVPTPPGVMYAYSAVTPPPTVDIFGGEILNLNIEITLSSPPLTTVCQALFYIAVLGIADGQVYTTADYGSPTAVVIPSPVSGSVAIIDVPIVDLDGFAKGLTGGCKIWRVGDDNCYDDEVLVLCVEIYGDSA